MSFDKYYRQHIETLRSDKDVFCAITQIDRKHYLYEGFRLSDGNDELDENMAWSDRMYGRVLTYAVADMDHPSIVSEALPLRRMSSHYTRHLSHLTMGDSPEDLTITHGRMHGHGAEDGVHVSTFLRQFWEVVEAKSRNMTWQVDSSINQLLMLAEANLLAPKMSGPDLLSMLHKLHVGWRGHSHYGNTAVMNVDLVTDSLTYL